MTRLFHFFFLALCLFPQFVVGQAIDINRLHRNTSSGVAYFLGSEKTVEGVVTVGSGVFADTLNIFVQDETAGLNIVAAFAWPVPLQVGMRLRITGTLDQFHGQTRLVVGDSSAIAIVAEQSPIPIPAELTCSQVAQSLSAIGDEINESRLILLQNVQVISSDAPRYRLQDFSGECDLTILFDPDLQPPSGVFDVIGLLAQADPELPFDQGYAVWPRFPADIFNPQSLHIIVDPLEVSITSTQVDFYWETDAPADSRLEYGLSESFELGTVLDPTATTVHRLALSDLQPATIYAGRAISFSAQSSDTSVFYFSTASDESSGEIQVYFTRSIDASLAVGEPANELTDLSTILIDRIDRARYSIDFCYYSFTHQGIADALNRAKLRGVDLRMITDWQEGESESSMIYYLRETVGIQAITDRFGDNDGMAAMHNKIFIFDHRLGDSGADDWLAVGSANATYSGSRYNAENFLLINDQSLCAAYTREFDEMWGSDNWIPGGRLSRMGDRKRDNTPHRFNVNGIWIEQYMSPSDNTEKHIRAALQSADRSAYFAQLAITSANLEGEVKAMAPTIDVRGVLDDQTSNTSVWSRLRTAGVDALLLSMGSSNLMHHKYLLVDADLPQSDPLVVTGSHNWSYSANTVNDENTLIIHDSGIANLYLQEFAARYRDAGGQADFSTRVQSDPVPETLRLIVQSFPNPFNAATRIVLQGPIEENSRLMITNILGRKVHEWHFCPDEQLVHSVIWSGLDQAGRSVSSGVYFVHYSDSANERSLKLLLTR